MPERAVDDKRAVWRDAHVTKHLDGELGGMDGPWHSYGGVERLLDMGREWNRLAFAAGGIDPPDLAFSPDHDRFAVGRPRVLRIESVNGPRLLEIFVNVAEQLSIAARLEIAHEESDGREHPEHREAPHHTEPDRRDHAEGAALDGEPDEEADADHDQHEAGLAEEVGDGPATHDGGARHRQCPEPVDEPRSALLSGIGPAEDLELNNIPQVHELPVGQGMQDHIATWITYTTGYLRSGSSSYPGGR